MTRIRDFAIPLAAATAVLLLPSLAGAQTQVPQCGPFDTLRQWLLETHKEVEVGGGIVNPRAVMLVFASPDGATWTIAAVGTDGKACIVSTGKGWFQSPVPNSKERES